MSVCYHFLAAVVLSPAPSSPLYLQALMPAPEDDHDSVATDGEQKPLDQESPVLDSTGAQAMEGESPPESMEVGESSSQMDSYENPFLKPPKRVKLKIL